MRFRRSSWAVLVGAVLAMGCSDRSWPRDAADPADAVDDFGRAIALEAPPERIISLVPSLTEVLVAMGAEGLLVARTRHDRSPRLAGLPSVGDPVRPSVERIAVMRPHLVVGWADVGDPSVLERLEDLEISVYAAEVSDLGDLRRHTLRLGRLLSLDEAARELVDSLDGGLADLRDSADWDRRPKVMYVVWPDPTITTGGGTYLDSLIRVAGGRNVFADLRTSWPTVSLEAVVREDPDVLVVAGRKGAESVDTSWVRSRPGWSSLSAVVRDCVLAVDVDLLERPGPRVVRAARTLHRFFRGCLPEPAHLRRRGRSGDGDPGRQDHRTHGLDREDDRTRELALEHVRGEAR